MVAHHALIVNLLHTQYAQCSVRFYTLYILSHYTPYPVLVTTIQRSQSNLRTMVAYICRISMLKLPPNPFAETKVDGFLFSMAVHIGPTQNGNIKSSDICLIV